MGFFEGFAGDGNKGRKPTGVKEAVRIWQLDPILPINGSLTS
jgi:hypothetical protein